MIELKNVSKAYSKDKFVLNDCNLTITQNKIIGLLGENGSGKTSLLKILAGILKVDEGEVTYKKHTIFENPTIKKDIVFVSDELPYQGNQTLENLKAEYAFYYPNFNQQNYRHLIQLFDLDEKIPLNDFSKGMKKQAMLVLGLALDCELLLIDETFDGLDLTIRYEIKKILLHKVATNTNFSVIISSHHLNELESLCDEIILIENGSIKFQKTMDNLQDLLYKVNVVYKQDLTMELPCRYHESNGKIQTFIIQEDYNIINQYFLKLDVVFFEILKCSLEEVLIYEMKGK